ncbi:MAG: CarD family transcriptional regulator [Eubacteriales bacterium]|nr:CarD family transcriptional regulator [Eubacteriales bacterium]
MFKEGEKISYPMHGAGYIEAIEDKTFLDEKKSYYVLKFSEGDIKVHVPVENAEKAGLRRIISRDEYNRVIESFKNTGDVEESTNWNRRNRENLEKMKSGDVFEIAEVIKSLLKRENRKNLSSSEKKMLGTSMQILVSELALASNKNDDEVKKIITRML